MLVRAVVGMLAVLTLLSGPGSVVSQELPPGSGPNGGGGGTLNNYRHALRTVQRGLDVLGGADALERAEGVVLEGEGVLDLGTLLQGHRPFEGDEYPIRERLAFLPSSGRLVHEERAPLNPDAWTWLRSDYRPDGTYRLDLEAREASWNRPVAADHLKRTIPHLLLAEILAAAGGLRYLGEVVTGGRRHEAVLWHVPERGHVTLLFDAQTGLLRGIESLADLPVRGDATVRWEFLDYDRVPGLGLFPAGYTIHVDDERLREVRWTHRAVAPTGGVLDPPADIPLPPATPFEPASGGPGGAGESPFTIRDLAPGVHLLVNLRSGFHVLFVDFGDHVVAVDAPAGWWELSELPPRDWARSPSPALGERYVEGIRSHLGDKPIRYVVLTHHHSDHAGGVRAFVEAGATVLGTEPSRGVAERTLTGSLSLAGREATIAPALNFERVEGERVLQSGTMEMRILDVGPNPHAEGMLAIFLPDARILYVSDLFDPWSSRPTPARDRLPVMRWFVEWLDRSGLDPERIYAIHGSALVTEANLAAIRREKDEGRLDGGG